MNSIKIKLESELQNVTSLIALKEDEANKAKKKYDISFIAALVLPALILVAQVSFTWNTLVWNPSDQKLWAGIRDTFSFVIGTFGVIAAITGMLGFNHRAKQLDLQQLRASKQVIMAELQFDLANQQFVTSQARENLKLYYDHESIFEKQLEHFTTKLEEKHGEALNILLDSKRIYKSFFPNNSPSSGVVDYDPKWPITAGGWAKESYGSFKGYVQQIESYIKDYPLISDDATDFEYEGKALVDIYNTLATIGFNKPLEDDAVKDLDTQFNYIQNIVFALDYLLSFNIINVEDKSNALGAMYNLFGGLFWPNQLNIDERYQ